MTKSAGVPRAVAARDPRAPGARLGWRTHVLLLVVPLLALAVRGLYLAGQADANPLFAAPAMDAAIHDQWARQIASGQGMGEKPYFRAPLYPYVLGWLYKLTGPSVAAGRLLGAVLGAAVCYLIALIGLAVADLRAGLLSGLLAAVYWPFVYFDGELLSVTLENLLNTGMLLVLLLAVRRGAWWLFLAGGVLWGLSAVTRPNVLALAPLLLAWAWLVAPAPARVRSGLRNAALIMIGGGVAVLPVTLRNVLVGGERVLVATNGGVNFYIGNNPDSNGYSAIVPGTRPSWQEGYEDTHRIAEADRGRPLTEREVSDYWYERAVQWIRSDPSGFLAHLWYKFRIFWAPMEIPNNQPLRFFADFAPVARWLWLGFPVVFVGGLAAIPLAGGDWRKWLLLYGFAAIVMLTVVAFFCCARYRVPVIPVLLVVLGAGLSALPARLRRRQYRRLTAAAAAGGLAGLLLLTVPLDANSLRQGSEAQGHFMLGMHYINPPEKRPPDAAAAVAEFERAVALRPNMTNLRVMLGRSLALQGRTAEAGRQFAEAVERGPNYAEARFMYAMFLAGRGARQQAAAQFEAALALQPAYAEAHLYYGHLLNQMGRTAEGAEHVRTAEALGLRPAAP